MLRRVLAGLSVSDAARVEVKLTKRAAAPPPPPATPFSGDASAAASAAAPSAALPYLEVSAAGGDVAVVHGVPLLGEPLRRSQVDSAERLVAGSGEGAR